MGRRAREERQEKREDYAAKISKNKRKTNLMATGILALIAVIVGYSIFLFMTQLILVVHLVRQTVQEDWVMSMNMLPYL